MQKHTFKTFSLKIEMSIKLLFLDFGIELMEEWVLKIIIYYYFLGKPEYIILPFKDVSEKIVLADKWSYFLISSAEIIKHITSFFLLHQALNMPLLLFLSYSENHCAHIGVWNHASILSSKAQHSTT